MATDVSDQLSSSSPDQNTHERAYSTLEIVETNRATSDGNLSGEWADTLNSGNLETRETPEILGEKVFVDAALRPVNRSGYYDGLQTVESQRKTRRICGLRRRYFRILITLAVLLIIGGAIESGIAGSSNKSSEPNSTTTTPMDVPGPLPLPSRGGLDGSSVTAVSWTGSDGDVHRRIFFQNRTTGHTMQSAWDSNIALDVSTAS